MLKFIAKLLIKIIDIILNYTSTNKNSKNTSVNNNNNIQNTNQTTEDKIVSFSIQWYLLYLPTVITNAEEYNRCNNLAEVLSTNKEQVAKQIVKMDKKSKELLLTIIRTMRESYMIYNSSNLRKLLSIISENKYNLCDDTIEKISNFGLENKHKTDKLLEIYGDLEEALTLGM